MTETPQDPPAKANRWLLALIPIFVGGLLWRVGLGIGMPLAMQNLDGYDSVDDAVVEWAGADAKDCGSIVPEPSTAAACVDAAVGAGQPFRVELRSEPGRNVVGFSPKDGLRDAYADPWSGDVDTRYCDRLVTTRDGVRGVWCVIEGLDGSQAFVPD